MAFTVECLICLFCIINLILLLKEELEEIKISYIEKKQYKKSWSSIKVAMEEMEK